MSDTTISIEIDGIEVTGVIFFRNEFGVGVEITSPYQFMKTRLLRPIEEYGCGGYMSDIGIDLAKFLLSKLYEWCSLAESKKEILIQKYQELLLERDNYHKAIEEIKIRKIGLRKKFKNGELTQTQYQTLLRQQYQERVNLFEKLISCDVDIFGPCFEDKKVNVSMVKNIVRYISKQVCSVHPP